MADSFHYHDFDNLPSWVFNELREIQLLAQWIDVDVLRLVCPRPEFQVAHLVVEREEVHVDFALAFKLDGRKPCGVAAGMYFNSRVDLCSQIAGIVQAETKDGTGKICQNGTISLKRFFSRGFYQRIHGSQPGENSNQLLTNLNQLKPYYETATELHIKLLKSIIRFSVSAF